MEETVLNGRYELLNLIGTGGMAMVYRARDRSLGRVVAIKMLHERLTNDNKFLNRFHQEARAAANLAHPNIVMVHDIGQDDGLHFIVMEYVEGQTLKQLIREQTADGNALPLSRTLNLAIQMCAGIGYAHRAGLIHCDVKPQNMIITPDDRLKVADFGIARAVTAENMDSRVWGTPHYFAPEQAKGEAATPASDVYSIGVVMFEMLTGQLPFTADTHAALAVKHIQTAPPNVTAVNPDVPQALAQIIHKVLAKEPSGRYRTAGQLEKILQSYRRNSETLATAQPVLATIPVAEQKTEIYVTPPSPVHTQPMASATQAETAQATSLTAQAYDWTAMGLGITALIMLLGLIPLWYLVYRAWAG